MSLLSAPGVCVPRRYLLHGAREQQTSASDPHRSGTPSGERALRLDLRRWDVRLPPADDSSVDNVNPLLPTEEVLLTYVAHWWSTDGARLAYLTINNSVTPVVEIPHFLGGLYPTNMVFPYPKVKMESSL